LAKNGTIILPISPFDDLFSAVSDVSKGIGSRIHEVYVCSISRVAKHSMHLANIFSEWFARLIIQDELGKAKQGIERMSASHSRRYVTTEKHYLP
jgi:hypothetical protein